MIRRAAVAAAPARRDRGVAVGDLGIDAGGEGGHNCDELHDELLFCLGVRLGLELSRFLSWNILEARAIRICSQHVSTCVSTWHSHPENPLPVPTGRVARKHLPNVYFSPAGRSPKHLRNVQNTYPEHLHFGRNRDTYILGLSAPLRSQLQ